MKIAIFGDVPIPSYMAHSITRMHLCEALAVNNEVDFFVPNRSDSVNCDDGVYSFYGVDEIFKITEIPKLKPSRIFYDIVLKYVVHKGDYDLFFTSSIAALSSVIKLKVDVLYEMHQPLNQQNMSLLVKNSKKSNFRGIVVISDPLKEYCINHGILEDQILVCRSSTKINKFISGIDYRSKFKLNNEKKTIGYAGSMYIGKGIEKILEISKENVDLNFLIAGVNINNIDFNEYENVFWVGKLKPSEVHGFLSGCDVLLMPYSESVESYGGNSDIGKYMSPTKLFEYIGAGKPIISSDLEILKIEGIKHCVIYASDSVLDWSLHIRDILNDPVKYDELCREYGRIVGEYSYDKKVVAITEFLNKNK